MRIALFQTRSYLKFSLERLMSVEPLGLEVIAANIPGCHQVGIYDLLEYKWLKKGLEVMQPHLCGITCQFTSCLPQALQSAREIKSFDRNIFVVVGGQHASLKPDDLNDKNIDAIVIGDGEITTAELIKCLENKGNLKNIPGLVLNTKEGQIRTSRRAPIKDLNSFPLPARHLLKTPKDKYFFYFMSSVALLQGSRGCPYKCKFCSNWKFYEGTYRFRSSESIFKEIKQCGAYNILFADDNFFGNIENVKNLARLISESKIKKRFFLQARSDTICRYPDVINEWKKIGLIGVLIGIEFSDDEKLKSVNKNSSVETNEKAMRILNSYKIFMNASFIVEPSWERKDFERLQQYIRKFGIAIPQFVVMIPFPGTEWYEEIKDKIIYRKPELFDGLHAVVPTNLGLKEFYGEVARLYKESYKKIPKAFLWHIVKDMIRGKVSLRKAGEIRRIIMEFGNPDNYLLSKHI